MPLPNALRLAIPALAVGGLLLANRLMDRVEATPDGATASPSAGLPPQPVAFGRFAFESPMLLLPKDVTPAQRAQWVPPFESVDRYAAFDAGFSVAALRGRGLADTTADLSRVPQGMLDGMRTPQGDRVVGTTEPVTIDGRPGHRMRGRFEGGPLEGSIDGVAVRAGDEYLVVILMGPRERVTEGAEHLLKTLRLQ
jgi:hypothetical protein